MATKPDDIFDIFQLPAALAAAQARMLPCAATLQHLADATQTMMRAQMEYGHAIMRAQADLLGAWLATPVTTADENERPSVAAIRQREYAAP
jgi:hypothetical protein